MNYVPAIGAPGSLMRHFQEYPEHGVAVLACLEEMVADLIKHATLGLNEQEVEMLKRAEAAILRVKGGAQ